MYIPKTVKKTKYLLKGIATYFPDWLPLPHHQYQFSGKGQRPYDGAMSTARAFYSVWMRTYLRAKEKGEELTYSHVAEIGPGDCIGSGIAALLFGAEKYSALDIVPTAQNFNNLEIFDAMLELFKEKTPVPTEIVKHRPYLDDYSFPLSDEQLGINLHPDRIARIRKSIENLNDMVHVDYNWYETKIRPDLIISSATMEHVSDPDRAYKIMYDILQDNGSIAHTIDYSDHHTAPGWNFHWTYGDLVWKIVKGKNVYFINRWTHDQHLKEIGKYFEIVVNEPFERETENNAVYPFNVSQGYIVAKKHVNMPGRS